MKKIREAGAQQKANAGLTHGVNSPLVSPASMLTIYRS